MNLKTIIRLTQIVGVILLALLTVGCGRSPVEEWKAEQQNDGPGTARLFFTIFLASQNEHVYEVAHPDLHEKIASWIDANEPICSLDQMPTEWTDSPIETYLLCSCGVTVEGIMTTIDESYSPYHIVTDYELVEYRFCKEKPE